MENETLQALLREASNANKLLVIHIFRGGRLEREVYQVIKLEENRFLFQRVLMKLVRT